MQYEDDYAESFKCGHGNYSVMNDHAVRVHECEIRDRKYSCISGIITLNEPNKVRLEGKTSYAYFSKRKIKINQIIVIHIKIII